MLRNGGSSKLIGFSSKTSNMNANILAIILILITNFKICQSRNYKNFVLVKLVPQNSEDMKFLNNLETQRYIDILFWKRPYKVNSEVHFLVNPVDYDIFKERASHYKLKFEVQSEDIQKSFDQQKVGSYHALRVDTFNLNEFHTLDNLNNWMADLANQNSKFVQREIIGRTVENRNIYAFSVNKNQAKTKAIVESGIHGHEWMTVAFVAYFFNELVNCDTLNNPVAKHLAYNYHWLLIPVVNPDGYEYTHKTDRLWRKSRRNLGTAYGVDLNRNFDHSFGKFGTSTDPQNENYCGQMPFSEPETKALANFIEYHRTKLKYYFSVHSYGQSIIIPYEDRIQHIENFSEMENYARQVIYKIYKTRGIKYRTGSIYDTTGTRVSGTSTSWVKKKYRIPYVYTLNLRDNGTYGHAVPSDQILATCQEGMVILKELMTAKPRYVRSLYGSATRATSSQFLVILPMFVLFYFNKMF